MWVGGVGWYCGKVVWVGGVGSWCWSVVWAGGVGRWCGKVVRATSPDCKITTSPTHVNRGPLSEHRQGAGYSRVAGAVADRAESDLLL